MCLGLLSRNLINEKSVFKMKEELSVTFFLRLLKLNKQHFNKVNVVKEFIQPVVESIMLSNCDDLS